MVDTPANLVWETSIATGAGPLALSPLAQTFNAAYGAGGTDTFFYFIVNVDVPGEWEWGTGHLSDSVTLVRDTIGGSSNGGAAINFSAGTKHVTSDWPAGFQISTESLATTSAAGIVERATVAEARNPSVDGKFPAVKDLYDAAAEVALTPGANIAWDMDTGINFTITLTSNSTLDDPTNVTVGKKGRIRVVQDGVAGWTLSFAANYEFAFGVAPTLTTAANAEDILYYDCISATRTLIAPVYAVG